MKSGINKKEIKYAWQVSSKKNPLRVCGRCFHSIEGRSFKHKDYDNNNLKFPNICANCFNDLRQEEAQLVAKL